MSELLKKLSARFPAGAVKQRSGGGNKKLDYIDIPETINRLRDTLGMDVSWEIDKSHLGPSEDGRYLGFVQGHLVVTEAPENSPYPTVSRWGGVGAMIDKDPDMAIKTATAEAIKKAGHGFQIALYLWSEDERALVAAERAAATSTDLNVLKNAVALRAKLNGVDPITPKTLAEHFGVTESELQDEATLRQLIEP